MSESKLSAEEIVKQKMFNSDAFSKWMGIRIISVSEGSCVLKMVVTNDMLNGFGIAHGGITFSLADSALAFASNSHGQKAVSIETSISHTCQVKLGDELTASATELHCSHRIGNYQVSIVNQNQETVAIFKGVVYRKTELW